MIKQIIAVIVFICFITVMAGCGAKEYQAKKSYSYEELKKLPADELYQLLPENGLSIDNHILNEMSENELKKIIKNDFELMIQGATSLSSGQYRQVAKEVQRVCREMVKDEEEVKTELMESAQKNKALYLAAKDAGITVTEREVTESIILKLIYADQRDRMDVLSLT
ncbi:MAG: hypothetical protein E7277_05325 [Lachnospiraceae bacterium]|nr:hypothetical protein [Lachnospiraceae bacterium]